MSFLSKLSKMKKDGSGYREPTPPAAKEAPLLPRNYVRDEDPAVRRLKEKRRLERLKNGVDPSKKPKKRRAAPGSGVPKAKKPRDDEKDIGTVYKRAVGSGGRGKSAGHTSSAAKVAREPVKKLSFEELMKEADDIAKAKAAQPRASASSAPKSAPRVSKPGFKKRGAAAARPKPADHPPRHMHNTVTATAKTKTKVRANSPPVRIRTAPQGLARPNAKLERKMSQRKHKPQRRTADDYYSDDDDLSDFIEDDEEEDVAADHGGSHREEIWAMFNRHGNGSARRDHYRDYDDDDLDDMETNEIDIMAEEEEATREARREDRREQDWLRRHDEEKARRKGRK